MVKHEQRDGFSANLRPNVPNLPGIPANSDIHFVHSLLITIENLIYMRKTHIHRLFEALEGKNMRMDHIKIYFRNYGINLDEKRERNYVI